MNLFKNLLSLFILGTATLFYILKRLFFILFPPLYVVLRLMETKRKREYFRKYKTERVEIISLDKLKREVSIWD